jgi:predicted nucleic acid-binding protein
LRVLVDTSVWVDFTNGYASTQADKLASLIEQEEDIFTCGVVVAEFLQGLRNTRSIIQYKLHFRDLEWLSPQEPDTYEEAAGLYRKLRSKGISVRSTIDCLIVRLAEVHGCMILARDRDISLILDSGLVTVIPC